MMNTWTVTALVLGQHRIDKTIFWPESRAGEKFWVPVTAAAVTDGRHRIVVDTGHHDTQWVNAHMAEAVCAPEEELMTALRDGVGWRAEDVDYVINTHLHFDHCGHNRDFPRAVFVTHRREWQTATDPNAEQAELYLPELFDERAISPDRWRFVEGDVPFLEGLHLIETPGHSAAHISVLAQTAEGTLCIAGDACCTLWNLDEDLVGNTVYSREQTAASYAKIRRSADRILPGHEPKIQPFQRHFPRIRK